MIAAMVRALPLLLLLSLAPHPASAQPAIEVSGGYAIARDPRDDVTLPAGWIAGVALDRSRAIAIVAEVSGQYRTVPLVGSEARLSIHTVLGGTRASARIGAVTEFVQVLAGVLRTGGSAFGASTAGYSLAIQPGFGVDYPLTRQVSARGELDLRFLNSRQETGGRGYQYRAVAALVYRAKPR